MSTILTKPYIFYHSHCQDGILAAGVMINFFEEKGTYTNPCITAYNHGDPINVKDLKISRGYNSKDKGKWINIEVYFLDILPSYDILKKVADTGCKIYILDHHKSAIKIIKTIITEKKEVIVRDIDEETGEPIESVVYVPKYQNIYSEFSLDYSGCGLAWKHATNSSGIVNPLIEFAQDRDIWKHNYVESNWVVSYLATYKRGIQPYIYARELKKWGDQSGKLKKITGVDGISVLYVNEYVVKCLEEGRVIFAEYLKECNRIALNYNIKTLEHPMGKYQVAITECPGKYASAVGDILSKLPNVDFAVAYEYVNERNGGNTQCRGVIMDISKDQYVYLRARAQVDENIDLSNLVQIWDVEGSTGGGHTKAAGSTSTMKKFISSFT